MSLKTGAPKILERFGSASCRHAPAWRPWRTPNAFAQGKVVEVLARAEEQRPGRFRNPLPGTLAFFLRSASALEDLAQAQVPHRFLVHRRTQAQVSLTIESGAISAGGIPEPSRPALYIHPGLLYIHPGPLAALLSP